MPPRRKAAETLSATTPVDLTSAINKQILIKNLDLEGTGTLTDSLVHNRVSQLQNQAEMLATSLDFSCKAILQRLSTEVKNMTLSELYSRNQGDIANIFKEDHALG
jgi:hypothetical protein